LRAVSSAAVLRIDVHVLTRLFGHIEKDTHQYAADSVDGVVPIETLSHQTYKCCRHDRCVALIFDDDESRGMLPIILADR
jgi:hypothetical protein